jgi:hypothetical protein
VLFRSGEAETVMVEVRGVDRALVEAAEDATALAVL